MINLRPYQARLDADIRAAYQEGFRAPLVVAPTGSGKTVILSNFAHGASAKGKSTLILAHREELIIQTSMTLANFGIKHSICAQSHAVKYIQRSHHEAFGKSFYQYESLTVVASIQTFVNRMHDFPLFDNVLVDEGHHAITGQWRAVLDAYPRIQSFKPGFTATPERLDGRGLGDVYDTIIEGPSIRELTDMGFLAPARIFAPPPEFSLEGIESANGDYARRKLSSRVDKPVIIGNAIDHYSKLCDGVPALAFCVSVDHAHHVAEQFCHSGYKAACIDGKMDPATRRERIKALADGRLNVLTSCDIISEGTDIPVVGAAILLRPTKSLALYLQQVGRVLRPYPGKDHAIILDHVGNTERHGLPDEERSWTLQGRKKRKSGAGGDNGPNLRQCLKCYALFPTSISFCPMCQQEVQKSKRELEQIEAELVEVQARQARKKRGYEESQCHTVGDFHKLAQARGYNNPMGWARLKFKLKSQKKAYETIT